MKTLLLAAAALAIALPASAATLYDSGDPTILWTTLGAAGDGDGAAEEFDFSAAVTITGLFGFIEANTPGQFTADVWSDGGHIGAVIFSQAITAVEGDPTWQGASGISWSLAAGSYWIGFTAPAAFTGSLWGASSNSAPVGFFAVQRNDGSWGQTLGADYGLRLEGTGGGDIGPGLGLAIGGGSVGGIPEPASWALMILGLGGVGAMLRAKRHLTTAGA